MCSGREVLSSLGQFSVRPPNCDGDFLNEYSQAVIGIELDPATAPPALLLTVGERREHACRQLIHLARELAWRLRIFSGGSTGGWSRVGVSLSGWGEVSVLNREHGWAKEATRALEALLGFSQLVVCTSSLYGERSGWRTECFFNFQSRTSDRLTVAGSSVTQWGCLRTFRPSAPTATTLSSA